MHPQNCRWLVLVACNVGGRRRTKHRRSPLQGKIIIWNRSNKNNWWEDQFQTHLRRLQRYGGKNTSLPHLALMLPEIPAAATDACLHLTAPAKQTPSGISSHIRFRKTGYFRWTGILPRFLAG